MRAASLGLRVYALTEEFDTPAGPLSLLQQATAGYLYTADESVLSF